VIEPKIDGSAISLVYENGSSSAAPRAATAPRRGRDRQPAHDPVDPARRSRASAAR
jgi:hypothetical protein